MKRRQLLAAALAPAVALPLGPTMVYASSIPQAYELARLNPDLTIRCDPRHPGGVGLALFARP